MTPTWIMVTHFWLTILFHKIHITFWFFSRATTLNRYSQKLQLPPSYIKAHKAGRCLVKISSHLIPDGGDPECIIACHVCSHEALFFFFWCWGGEGVGRVTAQSQKGLLRKEAGHVKCEGYAWRERANVGRKFGPWFSLFAVACGHWIHREK